MDVGDGGPYAYELRDRTAIIRSRNRSRVAGERVFQRARGGLDELGKCLSGSVSVGTFIEQWLGCSDSDRCRSICNIQSLADGL